ncbi:MAG: DUF1508 domain-containing protein [Candidatus Bathyarchaeota archaeon]|nr:DUF1508 domain-containing protein [Candidatus Bathyarchaeota archaeon]
MTNGTFEVYKDLDGKYRFRLRAPNNKILAVGKGYTTKKACMNGVNAVKRYSSAEIVDLTSTRPQPPKRKDITAEIHTRAKTLGVASTILYLENPTPDVPRVAKGTPILFRGQLKSGSTGISRAKIVICEHDRSFMNDDHIATGITRVDGTFAITWEAQAMDWWDDSVEVYARYEGSDTYLPTRSKIFTFHVS